MEGRRADGLRTQGETGATGDGVKFPERHMKSEDILLTWIIQTEVGITRDSSFHRPDESTPAGLRIRRGEGDRRNMRRRSLSQRKIVPNLLDQETATTKRLKTNWADTTKASRRENRRMRKEGEKKN